MILDGEKSIFSCFNPYSYLTRDGHKMNTFMETRLVELNKEIDTQIERIQNNQNRELLEVVYLFFDEKKIIIPE